MMAGCRTALCWTAALIAATLLTAHLIHAQQNAQAPAGSDRGERAKAEASPLLSGPYVIDLTSDGATLCWQTAAELAGKVRIRAAGDKEWKEIETPTARFHARRLSGLDAGKKYQAEVQGGGRKLGELTFRTAPVKAETFTFYVYGDTRTNSRDHARVADAMLAEATRLGQFTFVLHTGDFAVSGSDEEETAEQFFGPAARLLARLPLVPVRGNHENFTNLYRKYFPPQDEADRQFGETDDRCIDYGPVRIVVLDKYAPRDKLPARLRWLDEKLREAEGKWKFVSLHEPMYTSGKHGSATQTRAAVEPILVANKVHAVLAGHDHNYERTKPIKGVTHFTAGGGGAPLRTESSRGVQDWSANFKTVLHFLTLTVTPKTLTVKAFGLNRESGPFEVFDSVEIPRDCHWPQPEPADSGSKSEPAELTEE